MRSRGLLVVAAVLAALVAPVARAAAPPPPPGGLPDGVPAAARRAEPALPVPTGWTGPEAFPRTSGTGRLAAGAFLWTDWLYDDHGPGTAPFTGGNLAEAGSPSFGSYQYPDGPAKANGADIFRAGVALAGDATVWRVDWNTLVDPAVPIAEWTIDLGDGGGSDWPAGAGIRSAGIDAALVVSSRGARLIDVASGRAVPLPVQVDVAARSFVVRVPRALLPTEGTSTVRLAAGLADAAGTGFASPVTNVTFRTIAQEPAANNFWNDTTQARQLLLGDVSDFRAEVDWSALAARATTPEATPTGWSDRWYVSSIEPGQGRRTDLPAVEDGSPAYLGRVQPYAVFVPTGYHGQPVALTFLLHSLTQNHNQYAATTPRFSQQACEDRTSICVTTLGRGPSGGYRDEAQLDFWEVWNRVASSYRLDPDRTITAGYSMGGIGSNHLAQAHPDLFAAAILLAGASGGDTPSVDNLRWVPTYLAGGAADELVPVTDTKSLADGLDRRGYRYRWLLHPAEDHVAYELQDGFSDAATYMGHRVRTVRPGRVTFRWDPADERPQYGFGTTGAYWLREVAARDDGPAGIDATSSANPDPAITAIRSRDLLVPGDPTPGVATQLDWTLGARPARRPLVAIRLANVKAVTVRLADAGIRRGERVTLDVTTDGPVRITLVSPTGARSTLSLPGGHHRVVR